LENEGSAILLILNKINNNRSSLFDDKYQNLCKTEHRIFTLGCCGFATPFA